jgi:hypothetical protein
MFVTLIGFLLNKKPTIRPHTIAHRARLTCSHLIARHMLKKGKYTSTLLIFVEKKMLQQSSLYFFLD